MKGVSVTNIEYRTFTPELEVRSDGDGRTVEGIAVPYDREQRIDDSLTEVFVRGAFDHQLRAMHRVPFFRDHQPHGGVQIGRTVAAHDDAAGLFWRGRVDKSTAGDAALDLIKSGKLRDLSVGFTAPEFPQYRRESGAVERRKANLTEVATVPKGAYGAGAVIAHVRAAACPTCGHVGEQVQQRTADTGERSRLAEAEQILAMVPLLGLPELRDASGLQFGHGTKLWAYWTGPEGFGRYAHATHPWTTLRNALIKEGVPVTQADGLATNIMQATPAGRALFAAHHGAGHH